MENVEQVGEKALTIYEQAMVVKITNNESYINAGVLWKNTKDMMKEISDTFDPIIESAHLSHKKAIEQKNKYYKPLETASKSIKQLMATYDAEQERIRLAEQRRLEEEARKAEEARRQEELARLEDERKAEEERLLQEAIEAEANGNNDVAETIMQEIEIKEQEIQEEIKTVKEEPVFIPPPIVQKTVPKVNGLKYSIRWDFEVTDIMALIKAVASGKLPKEALQVNTTLIRQQVTSLKDAFNWPGIRTFKKIV